MLGKLLDRYILIELVRVFMLAIVGITSILVLGVVIHEAAQKGLGPSQIVRIVPLMVPGTLPFTVPATMLFAVSVVYGRMAHDNEVTAVKAAGIPVTKILVPAWMMGLALSAGIFMLYGRFIPTIADRIKLVLLEDMEATIYSVLRKNLSFHQIGFDYSIWVERVEGRRLISPVFKKTDEVNQNTIVATAREAEIHVNYDKQIVELEMLHADISYNGSPAYFERETIPIPLPDLDGKSRRIRARERTNDQIHARLQEVTVEEDALRADYLGRIADSINKGEIHLIAQQHLPVLKNKLNLLHRDRWELNTELALRPALALGSFVFVLIGCPVAIWFHKGDYLSVFVTSFLPIVITYYPLTMFGINLGKEGRFDPDLLLWTANAVVGSVGVIGIWRLVRR